MVRSFNVSNKNCKIEIQIFHSRNQYKRFKILKTPSTLCYLRTNRTIMVHCSFHTQVCIFNLFRVATSYNIYYDKSRKLVFKKKFMFFGEVWLKETKDNVFIRLDIYHICHNERNFPRHPFYICHIYHNDTVSSKPRDILINYECV